MENSNACSMDASRTLDSIIAKFWEKEGKEGHAPSVRTKQTHSSLKAELQQLTLPMQLRLPAEKPRKAYGCLPLVSSRLKRSGRNSSTSAPQICANHQSRRHHKLA